MINLVTNIETERQKFEARPTKPRYTVEQSETAFTVRVWLPGVDRTALETTVNEELLTVVGRRAVVVLPEWNPIHREISKGDYRLELNLNRRVNGKAITAELNQGILTLTLPKAEVVKGHKVEVRG